MNLRFVEAFYWVVSLKSVSRAAEKLHITQSAMSSRIAALEEELCVLLLDRRDKQFRLTVAGLRFFSRPDVNFQTVYEMARRKELSETRALYAQALRLVVGDSSVDASKLPEFEHIRRYLGPAGIFATNQADGWLYVGFALKKTGP